MSFFRTNRSAAAKMAMKPRVAMKAVEVKNEPSLPLKLGVATLIAEAVSGESKTY